MKKLTTVLILALTFSIGAAYAHSGRTDKNGCHNDRKTDTRHCH